MSNIVQQKIGYPKNVPVTNFKVSDLDIVQKYKLTWILEASSNLISVSDSNNYTGLINIPQSLLNMTSSTTSYYYWIYGQFYSSSSTGVSSAVQPQPSPIVFTDLSYNSSSQKYTFKYNIHYQGGIFTYFIKFIIMLYTPYVIPVLYDTIGSSSNNAVQVTPNNINYKSNLTNYSGNDLSKFFPIIQYAYKNYSSTPINSGTTGTINIQKSYNTNANYTVITTIEQNGSNPIPNTKNISQVTIFNNSSTSFSFYFFTYANVSFKLVFIIFFSNS